MQDSPKNRTSSAVKLFRLSILLLSLSATALQIASFILGSWFFQGTEATFWSGDLSNIQSSAKIQAESYKSASSRYCTLKGVAPIDGKMGSFTFMELNVLCNQFSLMFNGLNVFWFTSVSALVLFFGFVVGWIVFLARENTKWLLFTTVLSVCGMVLQVLSICILVTLFNLTFSEQCKSLDGETDIGSYNFSVYICASDSVTLYLAGGIIAALIYPVFIMQKLAYTEPESEKEEENGEINSERRLNSDEVIKLDQENGTPGEAVKTHDNEEVDFKEKNSVTSRFGYEECKVNEEGGSKETEFNSLHKENDSEIRKKDIFNS
jgi:hypothetical protein